MDAMEYQVDGLTVVDEGYGEAREQLVGRMIREMERIRDEARNAWMDARMSNSDRVLEIEYCLTQMIEMRVVLGDIMGVKVRTPDGRSYTGELFCRLSEWRVDARQGRRGGR